MQEIFDKAAAFCEENHVNNYPVNIVDLCKSQGFSVYEEYLPSDVSGFIVAQDEEYGKYNSNKVIVVNLSDTARRRRFTIAHELGHYYLHKQEDSPVYAHRDAGQNGGLEKEANLFASAILMPEKLIEKALDRLKSGRAYRDFELIAYIADEFAVSKPAAEVRLKHLKKI